MANVAVQQFIHKHLFAASRTIARDELGNIGESTKQDLGVTLAQFIAKKTCRTSVDGEAVMMELRLVVVTPEELQDLVEGLDQIPHEQGELHVGNDAS
jgi:hypothetical protein